MRQITRLLKWYFKDGYKYPSWWKANIWILLAIPSLLWWKESVLWVILLSLFANYEASMAEYKADKARVENAESNN